MDWTKIHDAVWDHNEEEQKISRLVSCNACGWVHFPVSLDYYMSLKDKSLLSCFDCGNSYQDFSPYIGRPAGIEQVFIQPILGSEWNV